MKHLCACATILICLFVNAFSFTTAHARTSSSTQKKKVIKKRSPASKKKKKRASSETQEDLKLSAEDVAAQRKHRRRQKALAEEYLQNERRRERARRYRDELDYVHQTLGGSLRLESRHFPESKKDSNAVDSNIALLGEFEMSLDYKNLEVKIWNLARADFVDSDRTKFMPYENWIAHKTANTLFKFGMQIENWSMTEIFHPSDVLNSRNLDSDLENTEKIGEPAISLRWNLWGGYATAFYMPIFWSPIFPSTESRLSAIPSGGKILDPIFLKDSTLNENDSLVNQYALRYTRKYGNTDIGYHYLKTIDRQEPLIVPDIAAGGFRPVFLPVTQMGINGSIVGRENIYKFDFVHRKFDESLTNLALGRIYQPDHNILALGLERTFSYESGTELTLFSEWQKILGTTSNEARSLTIFQNDIMLGGRYSLNDLKSREFKAYMILDLTDKSEIFGAFSFHQKMSTNLKLSTGYRTVMGRNGLAKELNDADHVFLNLTYFFER